MKSPNEKNPSPSAAKRPASCKARLGMHLRERLTALRALWKAHQRGSEKEHPEYGTLCEYGLAFDYVAPGTFRDQREPYFRYQLSWGGPSDEFRIFASRDAHSWAPYRVEYWFLDWFDGAHRILTGEDLSFFEQLFAWFDEVGSTESAYREALKE